MRSFDEIKANKQVKTFAQSYMPGMYGGWLNIRGEKRDLYYQMSVDGEEYEHVSVHYPNCLKKTPSWEVMCKVKDIFWRDDEEVHQIHPSKYEYLHGIGSMENVLHLWRPVKGWDW